MFAEPPVKPGLVDGELAMDSMRAQVDSTIR
jgi:hypothetical protein